MWFNQAKCDIYMGTGAGTKLLHEISNAQHSVKISSPYLSPKLVQELICLHQKGIKVSLITSDTLDGGNHRQEQSLKPLMVQQRHVDAGAKRLRQRLSLWKSVCRYGSVLTLVLLVVGFLATQNTGFLWVLPVSPILWWVSGWLMAKKQRLQVFSYSYHSLFPFKVYVAPDGHRINDMLIHGKIYIIDGHTAYLGSLNFTESGTKYNYETRVRVTDLEAVKKIDAEFEDLYHREDMAFLGIGEWGSYLYPEPIN